MARKLFVRRESWPLKRPFSISRGTKTAADVVYTEVRESNDAGCGECVPYVRYGETVDGVVSTIESLRAAIEQGMDRKTLQRHLPPGAARNALDCALWDLEAKQSGVPVWQRASLPRPESVLTAVTVSLAPPDVMAQEAAGYGNCKVLKLKLGAENVINSVRAVRKSSQDSAIIIDANEAWTLEKLSAWQSELAQLGVSLIEQPLPAGQEDGLERIEHPVPICADESCHTSQDLVCLKGRYEYVNIKLDKTGGLTEALRLRQDAEKHGFGIMVGCMVGTSLAMAPAILLACDADFVDLDGPVLLTEDREPSLICQTAYQCTPKSELWGWPYNDKEA